MQIFAILIFVGVLAFTIIQGKQLIALIREKRKAKKAAKAEEVATAPETEKPNN